MNHKKWDIYVYGDINIDLVIPLINQFPKPGQEDIVEVMDTYVGGGAALFTLGVSKLGLYPVFQGAVGNDIYGDFILRELKKSHVDCTLIEKADKLKTGISISFTNKNDRSFLTYTGTNGELDIEKLKIDMVKNAAHIHMTGYAGSTNHDKYLRVLKLLKESSDVTVSFDLGWDPTGEWYEEIKQLFPFIDVLLMNETEAIHYSRKSTAQEAAVDFAQYGLTVALKLGAQGSLACKKGKLYYKEGYTVNAVDTTGAGDSFNAGYIYGFIKRRTIEECLTYGNACGALSVTAFGGNTGFPNEAAMLSFITE